MEPFPKPQGAIQTDTGEALVALGVGSRESGVRTGYRFALAVDITT
jgi:hypothetical protein